MCGMNLVFVGAEVGPWSKTGGLGDVLGGLPHAMAANGHRVMTVSPRYDQYKDAWDTEVELEVWGRTNSKKLMDPLLELTTRTINLEAYYKLCGDHRSRASIQTLQKTEDQSCRRHRRSKNKVKDKKIENLQRFIKRLQKTSLKDRSIQKLFTEANHRRPFLQRFCDAQPL